MASVGSTTAIKKVRLNSGGVRWEFQYTNWRAVQHADGSVERVREQRTVRKQTEAEATSMKKAVIAAHSRGELFVPGSERPTARLRDAAVAYAAAAANAETRRYRTYKMNRMLSTLGTEALVSDLSSDALRLVAKKAQDDGLKLIHKTVAEVERMWTWAARQDKLPGVPPPRRITDGEIRREPPVYATATPALADCDSMIACLSVAWHRRVATILRYCGLRVSQVLTLDRSDVNLDEGWLRLRSDALGAKRGGHRVVPMHEALVAEMRTWGMPAKGPLFMSHDKRRKEPGLWNESALGDPFRRAWKLAGVAEAKWGAPADDAAGRKAGRPTHAFRGAVETALIRAGAEGEIARMITGHARNATHDAYIVSGDPTASPYWQKMVEAHALLPPIDLGAKVISLGAAAQPRSA